MPYDHQSLEKQWQQFWTEQKTFETENPAQQTPLTGGQIRPKKYILDMFPYPSGAGLHVGHPKGYTATDIVSRYYHAKGYNVLHPMGFDAFGLPAENYAIKTGTHPAVTTAENIATFTEQLQKLGFSYDWSRKVDTTNPEYYRWTQWIFLQLFERGLAYEQDLPINYCPSCKTGLANEEVHTDNTCDRCGTRVDRKKIRQWVLRITQYADRLLSDLDSLDWPDGIKEMQRNWIGRSEGCEFELKKSDDEMKKISVYTTRIDTVYGMTYVVLAPDHPHVQDFITEDQRAECEKYILDSRLKSDQDRTAENKEKTGVFTGSSVINPYNGESVPLWIADYVLGSYGTGAVMAVPAHDERDFEFAKKYNLLINPTIFPKEYHDMILRQADENISDEELKEVTEKILSFVRNFCEEKPFTEYGFLEHVLVAIGSEHQYEVEKWLEYGQELGELFQGLSSQEAKQKLTEYAEQKGFGQKKVNYKLRDWLFSRQRYWGEPIPLIHISREEYEKLPRIEGAKGTKKSKNSYSDESEGVAHNGNTAKYLLHRGSIFKNIENVKKKDKNIAFSEIDVSVQTDKGIIRFVGKAIEKHFSNKNRAEFALRKRLCFSVIHSLSRLTYDHEGLGYFAYKDQVVRVVLKEISPHNYIIKTYYVSQSYSRLFNTASIENHENQEYLCYRGKVFSKIYDGINSKIIIDSRLPLTLPEVEKYEPAGDGQSPLATVESFVNVKLAENLSGKRETNTMPQWGGSCWYYLRYMDTMNREALASKEALDYWGMVDEYVGGAEHAVLHLLYARFWHKVLYDLGVVSTIEPFAKLTNVGLILAYAYERPSGGLVAVDLVESAPHPDPLLRGEGKTIWIEKSTGEEVKQVVAKMSKSLKNVINPNDIVAEYGADTLRLYEMSMGAFTDSAPWNPEAIIGSRRFLDKIYVAFMDDGLVPPCEGGLGGDCIQKIHKTYRAKDDMKAMKLLHKTIKKVGEDIVEYKFNTAISSLIILMNEGIPSDEEMNREWKIAFLTMLHPFAPHMAEELYRQLTEKKKTLLILHGFGDTGGDHWASWVADQAKKMGYEVILPDIPYETGDMSACLDSLESYISRLDTESVIIGHSMGTILGMKFIESLDHPISRFISVAGVFPGMSHEKAFKASPRLESLAPILESLISTHLEYNSIRKNIQQYILITSDNDSLIDQEEQKEFFSTHGFLDSYIVLSGRDHFSENRGGILELPEILPFLDSSWEGKPQSSASLQTAPLKKEPLHQSIYHAPWPEYDEWMLVDDEVNISIQVNGKLRGVYQFMNGVAQEEVSIFVREQAEIQKWLDGKELVKEIWIPNKMLSIVVR